MRFLLGLFFIKSSIVNELLASFLRRFRKHKSLIVIALWTLFER